MATSQDAPYTHSHVIAADGTMTFACGTGTDHWPWLALDPFDPIVIQTLNYYAAYEIAIARGRYDPGQWTALTHTDWTCGHKGVGHAVRGVALAPDEEDSASYRVTFYDENNALVSTMSGDGVVFRNRDFASWREAQKRALAPEQDLRDFPFVPAQSVGLASPVESYLSEPVLGETVSATALVTSVNGFPPLHPYHDGSGDHVNSAHLADAARQLLRCVRRDPGLEIHSGEMLFQRYVELGRPFQLVVDADGTDGESAGIAVTQFDQPCATIRLGWNS